MASVIYYKLKNAIQQHSVHFDGSVIQIGDVKRLVAQKQGLGVEGSAELTLYDPNTNDEYADDGKVIPRNTLVLVKRAPVAKFKPLLASEGAPAPPTAPAAPAAEQQPSAPEAAADGNEFGGDIYSARPAAAAVGEDESRALQNLLQGTAATWMREVRQGSMRGRGRGRGGRGGAPLDYRCPRCEAVGAHWVQDCPTQGDAAYDRRRIRPPVGIPMTRLARSEEGGLALPDGQTGTLVANEDAFAREILGLGLPGQAVDAAEAVSLPEAPVQPLLALEYKPEPVKVEAEAEAAPTLSAAPVAAAPALAGEDELSRPSASMPGAAFFEVFMRAALLPRGPPDFLVKAYNREQPLSRYDFEHGQDQYRKQYDLPPLRRRRRSRSRERAPRRRSRSGERPPSRRSRSKDSSRPEKSRERSVERPKADSSRGGAVGGAAEGEQAKGARKPESRREDERIKKDERGTAHVSKPQAAPESKSTDAEGKREKERERVKRRGSDQRDGKRERSEEPHKRRKVEGAPDAPAGEDDRWQPVGSAEAAGGKPAAGGGVGAPCPDGSHARVGEPAPGSGDAAVPVLPPPSCPAEPPAGLPEMALGAVPGEPELDYDASEAEGDDPADQRATASAAPGAADRAPGEAPAPGAADAKASTSDRHRHRSDKEGEKERKLGHRSSRGDKDKERRSEGDRKKERRNESDRKKERRSEGDRKKERRSEGDRKKEPGSEGDRKKEPGSEGDRKKEPGSEGDRRKERRSEADRKKEHHSEADRKKEHGSEVDRKKEHRSEADRKKEHRNERRGGSEHERKSVSERDRKRGRSTERAKETKPERL